MILLKTLQLNNFLSHEQTTIVFSENEKLLLDGKSGSGKSSITDAILWAFYGKGRADNRSLVRRGEKTGSVTLKLIQGPTEFVITRTISNTSGKNTLVVTCKKEGENVFLPIETTGLKDTQNWIESHLLRASWELFTNSIAYPQENENSFVKTNASRRKDLLLEIVGASSFDELYEKARVSILGFETVTTELSVKREGYEKVIKENEETASKTLEAEIVLEKVIEKINEKVKREKELVKIVGDAHAVIQQIKDKTNMLHQYDIVLEGIDNRIAYKERLIKENETIDIKTAREKVTELEKLETEAESQETTIRANIEIQNKINNHLANKPVMYDYSKDIERANIQLIPLIQESGSCPAGDNCPFVVPIKGQIQFLETQIVEKEQKMVEEGTALALWLNQLNSLPKAEETNQLYTRLTGIREQIKLLVPFRNVIRNYENSLKMNQDLREQIEGDKKDRIKTVNEYNQLGTDMAELEKAKKDISKEYIELHNLPEILEKFEKERTQAIMDVTLSKKAQETVLNARQGLQDLAKEAKKTKTQYEDLLLLKEALGPRGVKAVVIDYLVPQLEERINSVLGQMSDFRIRLDTQKATADEEGIKEGLFITVINDRNEELSFSNYSGGEKVKITIAISEALASLMSQVGFRIMDENIVSLDKESTEGFVEVLTKLQDKFPQLLVISHLQEVKDIFEKRIMITKNGGISKII